MKSLIQQVYGHPLFENKKKKSNEPAGRLRTSLLVLFLITTVGFTGCSDTPFLNGQQEEEETDTTPPVVESSEPASGNVDVSVDADVTLTFSEEIDSESVYVSFYNPSSNASVRGSVTVTGNTLTFDPEQALRNSSSYEVLLLEAEDLAGNPLEEAFSLVFHTE